MNRVEDKLPDITKYKIALEKTKTDKLRALIPMLPGQLIPPDTLRLKAGTAVRVALPGTECVPFRDELPLPLTRKHHPSAFLHGRAVPQGGPGQCDLCRQDDDGRH